MRVSVEELFLQVERESVFDEGKAEGKVKAKNETIVNMLAESIDIDFIQKITGCSREHILELQNKHFGDN